MKIFNTTLKKIINMASKNKKIVIKHHRNQKTFSYEKGNVNLSFTLDIDIKSQLLDYIELLGIAQEDVAKAVGELDEKE